jgi:demethylmenaquinone methyltransferase/2-methoxy-6-polyprenyl-1,4-benzoquinol methylase
VSEERRRPAIEHGGVDRVFDEGAPYYDRLGRLITLGVGGWYRRWALALAGLRPGMAVLDVGVGTGAVARAARRLVGTGSPVVGLDPSRPMLGQVREEGGVAVVQGRAEALPFREATFDFVTIGYALRYIPDLDATFAECCRVLRPGGTLLVLELTRPQGRAAYGLVRFYLETAIPWLVGTCWDADRTRALVAACWGTIDRGVAPAAIHGALRSAGLEPFRSVLRAGVIREELARRPPRPRDGAGAAPHAGDTVGSVALARR